MGLLLMMISICGLLAAIVLLGVSVVTKKARLAEYAFGGLAIWLGIYGLLLLGTSYRSRETVLSLNEAKEFCGFYTDCHLHAAVTNVRRVKSLDGRAANGVFSIVTVRVFSDARRAELGLYNVGAHVVDAAGAEYTRDTNAESQLLPQPDFEQQVGPGASFEKQIVFDLPADVQKPRLDAREKLGIDIAIEKFLIGDEDSFRHKRTYFDVSD